MRGYAFMGAPVIDSRLAVSCFILRVAASNLHVHKYYPIFVPWESSYSHLTRMNSSPALHATTMPSTHCHFMILLFSTCLKFHAEKFSFSMTICTIKTK